MRNVLVVLFVTGCLSHLPPIAHTHMQIHWAKDYAAAAEQARSQQRPILAVMAAGQIDGLC